jgi:hypothetical protein
MPNPPNHFSTRVSDPTEEEIKQRAEEIRATWTEAKERNRRGLKAERDCHLEVQRANDLPADRYISSKEVYYE